VSNIHHEEHEDNEDKKLHELHGKKSRIFEKNVEY